MRVNRHKLSRNETLEFKILDSDPLGGPHEEGSGVVKLICERTLKLTRLHVRWSPR